MSFHPIKDLTPRIVSLYICSAEGFWSTSNSSSQSRSEDSRSETSPSSAKLEAWSLNCSGSETGSSTGTPAPVRDVAPFLTTVAGWDLGAGSLIYHW